MMMLRVIVLASALALVKAAPNTSRNLASRELGRDDRSSPSSPQCESDSTMAALDQGRSLAIRAHNFFRANTELASHGLTSRPMRQPFFFWAAYVPPFGTTGSLYLDNHKCASTSIRNLLGSVLSERCHAHCFNAICNVSAGHPCHNLFVPPSAAYDSNPHMNPETLTAAGIRKAAPFIWTMVRDPVSKFNSGVFQVKLKDKRLRNMTAVRRHTRQTLRSRSSFLDAGTSHYVRSPRVQPCSLFRADGGWHSCQLSSACSTTLERWRTSHEVLGMRWLVSWGYNPTCRTTEKRSNRRTFFRRMTSVDCADQHSTSMTGRALDTLFQRSVQDHKYASARRPRLASRSRRWVSGRATTASQSK